MTVFDSLAKFSLSIAPSLKRLFLVCGQSSFRSSGADRILKDTLRGIEVVKFSGFAENPKFEDALRGARAFSESGANAILAVGGGSAIDIAKLIKAIHHHQGVVHDVVRNLYAPGLNETALYACPTTAGSGSEATHFAVVYMSGKKFSVAHPGLLPNKLILDPLLTESMPPYLSACTGMDALCQAIESYWSVNSNEESKQLAGDAITLVSRHLPEVISSPSLTHRKGMLRAANLAGRAINLTKTTGPHACSYSLTSRYGLAHGHAVAIFLPPFLNYNANVSDVDVSDLRGASYVRDTVLEIAKLMGANSALAAKDRFLSLMHSIGLKSKLSELGIEKECIAYIREDVNAERLSNNPRRASQDDIGEISNEAYR